MENTQQSIEQLTSSDVHDMSTVEGRKIVCQKAIAIFMKNMGQYNSSYAYINYDQKVKKIIGCLSDMTRTEYEMTIGLTTITTDIVNSIGELAIQCPELKVTKFPELFSDRDGVKRKIKIEW